MKHSCIVQVDATMSCNIGMQLARSNMPQSTTAALRKLQTSCKHKFDWTDELRDAFTITKALGT